jgi:hypothetical protein
LAEALRARRRSQVADARAFPFGQDPAITGVGQAAAGVRLAGIKTGNHEAAWR